MRKFILLSSAMLIAAGVTAKENIADSLATQMRLHGGPGLAVSGTQSIENMPVAAQNFLNKNFGSEPVKTCHEDFIRQSYHVVLVNGTHMTFDKNGKVKDIHMADNQSIPEQALTYILPDKTITHLRQAGVINQVTSLKDAGKNGFGVALLNNIPSQMIFDVDGTFVIVAG